ncbi:MAG TPA: hypothetical protein VF552_04740 [Allosphingosinicella sp.]|jgi:hypothetical protein
MRTLLAALVGALALGAFLLRPGASASESAALSASPLHSRAFAAPPAAVVDALRRIVGDSFELASRSDSGDHFRRVIPASLLAESQELGSLPGLGDMIVTARVHPGGAESRTAFTVAGTSADITIGVREQGGGSVVTVETAVTEGSGDSARRVAAHMRAGSNDEARRLLARLDSSLRPGG